MRCQSELLPFRERSRTPNTPHRDRVVFPKYRPSQHTIVEH